MCVISVLQQIRDSCIDSSRIIPYLSQMTTRSNTPASPPHPGLQPGLKNAEYMKRWDKSGYITVLTSYPMANRH